MSVSKAQMPSDYSMRVKNAVDQLISSCTESMLYKNHLEIPHLRLVQASKTLQIPEVNSENVIVDFPNKQIIFNIPDQEPTEGFTWSILGLHGNYKINISDMSNFPQDFAFGLFADLKPNALNKIFPAMDNADDDLTPDFHFENEDLKLIMKFSTSRDPAAGTMRRIAEQRSAQYEGAIRGRVGKLRVNKHHCFSTMVCSKSSVLLGSFFTLHEDIINEICARYRFALDVLTEIGLQGLDIEDSHVLEMKGNILKVLKSIPEMYQNEFASSRVKMTKDRIITSDISPEEAEEFIANRYRECLKASLKDSDPEGEINSAESIREKFSQHNSGTRMHVKHVLQLPNCIPPARTDWKWERSTEVDGKSSFINSIINTSFFLDFCPEESAYELKRKACLDENDPEVQQSEKTHKIVHCTPSYEYQTELAINGVQGKTRTGNAEVKAELREKKIPFSLNVDTSDINKFLFSEIPADKTEPCASVKKVRELVLEALNICDSRGSNTEIIMDSLMTNVVFNWCSFISAIASELCISLKQKVKQDEWIVKKLRDWDAYLIIKTARSRSLILFFSLVMPTNVREVIPEKIARKPEMYSNYSVIEFISTNDMKLVNLVKTEAFFIAMMAQWSRHYGLSFLQGLQNADVWTMTKLSMLVHLEDKPRTEEIMTLFRYISMEKFSTCTTSSGKMLEKFPTCLRSRLQVWISKKLVDAMCMPNYEPVVAENIDGKWRNMINPYTGKAVDSPAQLIELFYVGYATNKDAHTEPISQIDLLKKVLQYEIKLHELDEKWCGKEERESLESYQFHEWSRRANCAAADHLKKYLQTLYGDKMENRLSEKIIHRLSQLTWDQVATLKASSQFDPSVGKIPNAGGQFTTQRIKVIIAILKKKALLAETPALSVASVLSWVNNDGGLRVDVVKKPQHGGLREIYILEVRSRILQMVLEEIARTICEDVPIEMMTHPHSKVEIPQTHMYEAAIKQAKYKRNICSSNDAKVWNQGHHVAKFAQFLLRVVPKDFHNFIVGGLKQFLFKRIALPDGALNTKPRVSFDSRTDPIIQKFWNAYTGAITVPWLRQRETFLRIESGMMQGILHYTSSLYHASMLMLRNSLWTEMSRLYSLDNISTDMVSSDDSARLTDIFSDDLTSFKHSVLLAKLDHIAVKHFSRMYGIWMSPKSTMCTSDVMEFNSEFYFHGNVFRPTLKWALASVGILEVESLVERQEVMYSYITNLLEGGSGFRQASETQLAQLFLHYRLMGMGINPLFLDYADLLMENPDPALGFFLLDPPIVAGLAGFNFILWKATTSHPGLNKNYADQLRNCGMSSTTSGQLTRALQIRSGDRKKVYDLITEVESVCPMWRENIEANPSVLYELSRNLESSLLKIMVKLTSPEVIRSLAKGSYKYRVAAAAVYLINGLVTTLGSNWMSTGGKTEKKVSLWRLASMKTSCIEPLTHAELNLLFPRRFQYEKLNQMIEEIKKFKLTENGTKKMLRCNVKVFKDRPHQLFELETVVRWRWFGEKLLASKLVAEKLWITYKKAHPWLEDDPFATLTNPNCHFENQINLRNFIGENSSLARSVNFTGAPVRGGFEGDLVSVFIRNNQMIGYTLQKPSEHASDAEDGLKSALAGILTFPLREDVKEKKITDQLVNRGDLWDGSEVKPSARMLKLALIQRFLKLKQDFSDMMRDLVMQSVLKSSKLATCGQFVQICSNNGWNGDGEWAGMIGGTQCRLLMKDFTLISVTTDDFLRLHENEALLVVLLEELGVTACQSLSGGRCVDLKKCQITHEGVVYENINLVQNFPVDLDQMFLRVDNDKIRLLCRDEKTGISCTVVAYTIEFSDFFSTNHHEDIDILNCWLNNTSLERSSAEKYLVAMMKDGGNVLSVDPKEFREFVKESLTPAIARAGLLEINALDDSVLFPAKSESIVECFADGNPVNCLENLSLRNDGDCFPELRTRNKVNYFDFCDYLYGDMEKENCESNLDDVKKNHRLWNEFVDDHMSTLSTCEKTLLLRRCFVPRISTFIQVVEYYLGVKFDGDSTAKGVEERS